MRDWIRMAKERAGELPPMKSTPIEFEAEPGPSEAERHASFVEAMAINGNPKSFSMQPTDWNPADVPHRAIVEVKHDGIPQIYSSASGHGITREGAPFHGASHTWLGLNMLAEMMGRQPHILHGEYVNPAGFNATLADFQRGHGNGLIVVFDAVPLDVYMGRAMSEPLHMRRRRLEAAYLRVGQSTMSHRSVALVTQSPFVGESRDNIELAAGEVWRVGGEGIIVKDADSPYVRAKSKHWMRIKRIETIDLPIGRVEVVDGKVQAIVVATASTNVRVAVGFSDRERAAPAEFRTGRWVEIKHNGVTEKGSLRSPRFSRFRDDKA